MNSKLARGIRCCSHDAALIRLASDYDGLPLQRRVVQLLHRHEKGIHVDVKDDSLVFGSHLRGLYRNETRSRRSESRSPKHKNPTLGFGSQGWDSLPLYFAPAA